MPGIHELHPGILVKGRDFQRSPGAFEAQQEVLLSFPESDQVLCLDWIGDFRDGSVGVFFFFFAKLSWHCVKP